MFSSKDPSTLRNMVIEESFRCEVFSSVNRAQEGHGRHADAQEPEPSSRERCSVQGDAPAVGPDRRAGEQNRRRPEQSATRRAAEREKVDGGTSLVFFFFPLCVYSHMKLARASRQGC